MLDPAIGLTLVGCFALLFAGAALHKLRDRAHFRQVLHAYRLLPEGAVGVGAAAVPVLELLVAIALLTAITRPAAALAGVVLLVGYGAAIATNLLRGRHDLACGCGGAQDARPIAPWMVVRNLLLALALASALLPFASRSLLPTDALTVAAGIAIAALLYASVDRLLGSLAARSAALRRAP